MHIVFKSLSTTGLTMKNNNPIFSLPRHPFPRHNALQFFFAIYLHRAYKHAPTPISRLSSFKCTH